MPPCREMQRSCHGTARLKTILKSRSGTEAITKEVRQCARRRAQIIMWSAALLNMPFGRLRAISGNGKQRGSTDGGCNEAGQTMTISAASTPLSQRALIGVVFCAFGWNTADLINRLVRWQRKHSKTGYKCGISEAERRG